MPAIIARIPTTDIVTDSKAVRCSAQTCLWPYEIPLQVEHVPSLHWFFVSIVWFRYKIIVLYTSARDFSISR